MSSPNRQELIQNAITFLADPKTQASSVAQRIQFLEAKGLTSPEIDIALKQAALNSSSSSYHPPYSHDGYLPSMYQRVDQMGHRWDWRDYFITAVLSGSVAYGAVALFRKYLLPHLQPPSSTAYEEDRDALTAQFDAAEALLREIQAESAAVRIAVEEQRDKIDKATANVETVVTELREAENKTRDEMREIRDEVNNIREMLPKMIDKNKESQTQSLSELQQELKSLKALLLSRGSSSTPSTPMPTLGRPTIPAWQLASPPSQNGVDDSSGSSSSQLVSPRPIPVYGKEKETSTLETS